MTFPTPRPKAAEGPSKAPRRTNHSRAPTEGSLRDLGEPTFHDEAACKQATAVSLAMSAIAYSNRSRARTGMNIPAARGKSVDMRKKIV